MPPLQEWLRFFGVPSVLSIVVTGAALFVDDARRLGQFLGADPDPFVWRQVF